MKDEDSLSAAGISYLCGDVFFILSCMDRKFALGLSLENFVGGVVLLIAKTVSLGIKIERNGQRGLGGGNYLCKLLIRLLNLYL